MRKIVLAIISFGFTTLAMSQTTYPKLISSGGESFKNTSFQMEWSIGEVITETLDGEGKTLTQGFHQSNYEITAIEENLNTIKSVKVYPNPTSDFISINFTNISNSDKIENILIITDINGKILCENKVVNQVEEIDFSDFTDGVYFLTIKQKNQTVNNFKIIKN